MCVPYVNLTHQASSYLLSFIVGFREESLSSLLLIFPSIRVQGTLLLFLIFLFVLLERSNIYHLESFISSLFCSPMLEHALYKIYKYLILKQVSRS